MTRGRVGEAGSRCAQVQAVLRVEDEKEKIKEERSQTEGLVSEFVEQRSVCSESPQPLDCGERERRKGDEDENGGRRAGDIGEEVWGV